MKRRQFQRQNEAERQKLLGKTVRKHLSADALIATVRNSFEKVSEPSNGKPEISIADCLMSAYAMFAIKAPSLLAFEERWKEEANNLKSIFKVRKIPSDTQMRTRLDLVAPDELRSAHNAILNQLQRGKALVEMSYLDEGYLMALDGTTYFSSRKLHAPFCLRKTSSETGKTTYQLQTLGAALVRPDLKEVIPLIPEIISRQDGKNKDDCEINASKRFLAKFHKEHPHLRVVVVQDAISPNGPYIRFLGDIGYRFILTVKEADHTHLFDQFDIAIQNKEVNELILQDPKDPKNFHFFHWMNDLAINASHPDVRVNILEYYEVKGEASKRFCWVTDIPLSEKNVHRIMKAGRARWKIENETFNTLKNQGYNFEHNYGLGEKHLSMVFVKLMMLAFLVDQTQQLCCVLFRSVWEKLGSKRSLWENVRSLFLCFKLDSMEMLYRALLQGFVRCEPILKPDTS